MAGWGDALGGLGGLYGSLIGDWLTSGEREKQQRLLDEQRGLYEDLPTDIRAEQEALSELGPSAYDAFREDPEMRQGQLRTLASLREISAAQGLDPQARAALAEAQASTAGQERAQRGSILDQFARQGGGGSNAALLAAITAQQGNAQRTGMEGLRAAGDAQGRQYQALRDTGALAGGVRSQDYGVASDRLGALDRVSAYNAANRQQVAGRNADRMQRTNEGNIGRKYQRAGMVGGTMQDQQDWYAQQERRRRGLGTLAGSGIGRNIGTGIDIVGGGGMP